MSKEYLSPAEQLMKLSLSIGAPVFQQERTYAGVIGKTLLEMDRAMSVPEPSESYLVKAILQAREANMSILEAAFSGKGIVVRNKG